VEYGKVVSEGVEALTQCPVPMVAMIRGTCVGGGLVIAALCDIRICGESSRFGVPVNKLGLVMAHAEMRGLHALVGPVGLREILLEGRVFGAKEALRKGLVNRVVADGEVEKEALAAASRIARGAPLVARWHKKFINRLSDPAPLSEGETNEAFACFGTQDYEIGLEAFLAKTDPQFKGE
jgi:enoyl-CoA hydratase/carnithine racemase